MDASRHNDEIAQNLEHWNRKPSLQKSYRAFHELIAQHLAESEEGQTVELGSGIGNIRDTIPNCLRTDLFPNPWIDQVENAYELSFSDESVSNLILFDVFHHLRYPGTALTEAFRVCTTRGRLIIFEPCISLLGQTIKDCLCGTKVLMRENYLRIAENRSYFGDFDPFGDFDLIFGASRINLKFVDLPIRYRERRYGDTNIDSWRHGWLLVKMVFFAARRIKFV